MLKLDAFALKWIAIVGMILNHVVIAWWEMIPVWLAIPLYAAGGLTFPIMAYFVIEGYKHTSNLKRYILRLLIFGLISIPFHALTFRFIGLNILFTIIMGIFAVMLYDKLKNRVLFWALFVLMALATLLPIPFDWSIIGIIVILLTHIIKDETKRRVVPSIVAGIFMLVASLSLWGMNVLDFDIALPMGYDATLSLVSTSFVIGCVAAAFLLKHFNGERGKRMKWLFYTFYPLHLAVLGLVALALGFVTLSHFGF